jgi:hypothetical protein
MTGFIKGLFGSKRKKTDESAQASNSATDQKKGAYFLDPDAAKTYGDIDYMRTAKTVKRTFPKTMGNQGEFSLTKQVSAMEDQSTGRSSMDSSASASTSSTGATPQPSFKKDEAEERRKTDTSMDMFRNMARDMRKP